MKRIPSKEAREKMSQSHMGWTNFKGHKHSEDTKERISQSMRRYHAERRKENAKSNNSENLISNAIAIIDKAIEFFKTR